MTPGPLQILLIIVLVLLIFGAGRVPSIMENVAINGIKELRCKPSLYKSCGDQLLVATITSPCANKAVKSRPKIIASAISVT